MGMSMYADLNLILKHRSMLYLHLNLKMLHYQSSAIMYISVDFLEKKSEVVKMKDAPENPDEFAMILQNAEGVKKQIYFDNPKIVSNNAILDELESFADAIHQDRTPVVSLTQGTEALRIAQQVIDCFSK